MAVDARAIAAEMRLAIDVKRALQEQLLREIYQAELALARFERAVCEREADERERRRLERIAGVPLVEVGDGTDA